MNANGHECFCSSFAQFLSLSSGCVVEKSIKCSRPEIKNQSSAFRVQSSVGLINKVKGTKQKARGSNLNELNQSNDPNLSFEILQSRPRRGFHWDDLNDHNLLTFVIFYLKKFLLACGTKASFTILGCET